MKLNRLCPPSEHPSAWHAPPLATIVGTLANLLVLKGGPQCLQSVGSAFVILHKSHGAPATMSALNLLWLIAKTKNLSIFVLTSSLPLYTTMFHWLLVKEYFYIHTCLVYEFSLYNSIPSFPNSNFLHLYNVSKPMCFFNEKVGENDGLAIRRPRI